MKDFLRNSELSPDVTDLAITPALQETRGVAKKPVQEAKGAHVP
jgi:hypothetical protein